MLTVSRVSEVPRFAFVIHLYYLYFIINDTMKATRKIKEEIEKAANEAGFSVEKALKTLANCSPSIYKAIGAAGVVRSSIQVNSRVDCGISILGKIQKKTEKAVAVNITFICIHTDREVKRLMWIPKNLINENLVPEWFWHKKIQEMKSEFSGYGAYNSLAVKY